MRDFQRTKNAGYTITKSNSNKSVYDVRGKDYAQNKGGLLGGLGYLGGSLIAGIGGVGEGIADLFTAAGAAIGGDFEYAKYVFKDNNVGEWHESITESYNPGGVMKFFGDVTHGIGQSSVFLLNAIPGLGQLGTAAFFAGTASQGISGAAAKTGDVGFGEVTYGLLSGGVEAGLEAAFGGMGKVAKNIGSPLLKNIGITATRKGLLRSVLTDAASEFGEEFASELIDPWLLNWTQVDPNARMSLGDAVYAGFVGLVSGSVSAGVSDVAKFAGNRKNGAKIMQSGNADTLINTANYVADKLIGQGADFKKAPEWAQHLRMQVNAYNDLVKNGKATGATAETILGEIQASLYFAETQSTHERIKAGIMAKSEADRAALAEYVNQTVDKSKRKKDYTAADVAADTDGIASQLATMSFVRGGFDIDGAIKDLQREGGIEDVINSERAQATERAEAEKKKAQGAETDAAFEAAVARGEASASPIVETPQPSAAQGAVDGGVQIEDAAAPVSEQGKIKYDLKEDVEDIESSATEIDDDIERIRGDVEKAVSKIQVDGKLYELQKKHINNIALGVQKYIRQGMSESDAIAKAVETRLVDIKSIGAESGVKHELGRATLEKVRGAVINAYREEMQNAAKTTQEARTGTKSTEVQRSTEKAAEGKNEAQGAKEIKINEPKEALTDEQRAERADKAAKAKAQEWVEWDKKTAPTMRELNRARELIKDFDDLEIPRRLAILRTIRSAENVDAVTLKGVVNIMSVLPKSDLEIRFAEGIGQKGVYTTVGGKKLIVLNSDTNFKTTIKGTIAHELVHYLEKRAGYKQFAEFVRKNAKPEAIERHKQRYIDGWAAIGYKYTESELEEEITASLVADALQSEKFLKRYADRDKKLIQRAASWFGGLIKGLKRKGEETREERKIAEAYGTWISALLQMPEVGEAKPVKKYALADDEATAEETTETDEAKAKRAAEEKEAKEAVERVLADRVRTYTKTEFRNAFNRAGNVTENVIGALLNGKRVGIKNQELSEIISDVYIAMYKASFFGDVGAVDAVKKIAQKAARYMVETQTVYDPETKRHVSLSRYIDDADILKNYEESLADDYFESFSKAGKDLKTYKSIATLQKRSEELKKMYFDYKELERYKKQVVYDANELKFIANTQKRKAADEGVRLLAKALGDTVNKKGVVVSSKVDAALAQASDFYNLETNTKFFGEEGKSLIDYAQVYDRNARVKIDRLLKLREGRQGKELTVKEMKLWAEILGAMRRTINEYNGLYKVSKWVDRTETAQALVDEIIGFFGFREHKKYDNKILQGLYEKGQRLKQSYLYSVISPEILIESLEGFSDKGILATFFHSVRDAAMLKEKMKAELIDPFDKYLDSKDNRWENEKGKSISFREKLNKKSIDLFGNELTLGEAIYLYGLCKREHAQVGLAKEGIKIYDIDGRLKKEIREIDAEKTRDWLYNQFDETDKKYIDMVEEFFNKTSTRIKTEADYEYLGYSNVIDSFYIPIIRDRFGRDRSPSDSRSRIADIITVYNERFNQHVVKNAKPCEVTNIQQIVSTHAEGLADYANLYMPLKSFDRLYNTVVTLEGGRTVTVREVLNDVWPQAEKYLTDLFADIQGSPRDKGRFDTLNDLAQRLTNSWVPSVLSANVSVILNQTTSYISAAQAIEPSYLARALGGIGHGMKEIGERADKYSKIIKARSFEEGAIRSQTNVEQVGKIGKTLGKGIEFTDRQTCILLFHASELKAEAEGAGAVGTEANAKKAAEICDRVIQDTQSVTSAADRGAWQRSPNLFSRAVTQFAGDRLKQFSLFYRNVARFFAHSQRAKAGDGDANYKAYLKDDAKAIWKSSATLIATSAYMAGIAWLIRLLFNTTEDKPEDEALAVLGDFTGNVIGVLPLVSDIYSLWNDGYEITPTSIDLVNETVKTTKNIFDLMGKGFSGQYISEEDAIKTLKNSVVTFSSLYGIPSNPILKQVMGIFRRVSPSSTYWYDSAMSSESSTQELNRALAKGDERLAQTILETKYKRESTGAIDDDTLLEICRLYQLTDKDGEYRTEVLPNRIPEDITSNDQRERFKDIYDGSTAAVAQLIDSLEYKNMTDDERIHAIKNTYKLFYDKARMEVQGKSSTNAMAYALILGDTSNLFLSQAKKSFMEAYEDKDGKEITVKDQVAEYLDLLEIGKDERTIISYALGYKGKDNKAAFLAYANSLRLSENDLKLIAERLDFDIKNGKLEEKEEK